MLPQILIGPGVIYTGPHDDAWLSYLSRIGDYATTIDLQFLIQVCFEHGERFNDYFPAFDLHVHTIQRRQVSATEIQQHVRYDGDEEVSWWAAQFDERYKKTPKHPYIIFDHMVNYGTWPFPPVIVDNRDGFADSLSQCSLGRPWHLFEGTHRISFLNRMLELNLLPPTSKHEIFWLSR